MLKSYDRAIQPEGSGSVASSFEGTCGEASQPEPACIRAFAAQ
jgi:hypothetical protein